VSSRRQNETFLLMCIIVKFAAWWDVDEVTVIFSSSWFACDGINGRVDAAAAAAHDDVDDDDADGELCSLTVFRYHLQSVT